MAANLIAMASISFLSLNATHGNVSLVFLFTPNTETSFQTNEYLVGKIKPTTFNDWGLSDKSIISLFLF